MLNQPLFITNIQMFSQKTILPLKKFKFFDVFLFKDKSTYKQLKNFSESANIKNRN